MILKKIRNSIKVGISVLFALGTTQVFAQNSDVGTVKTTNIKGYIEMTRPIEWVYLNYNTKSVGAWIIDSSRVVNGEFGFKAKIYDVNLGRVYIRTADKKDVEMVSLFMEPGKNMTLRIKNELISMKVEGSKAHEAYVSFNEKLKPFEERLKELRKQLRGLNETTDKEEMKRLDSKFQSLNQEIEHKVYEPYILEHPESPIMGHVLAIYTGSWLNVTLEKLEKVQEMLNGLPDGTRHRPSVKDFADRLNGALNSTIGRPAVDFTLNDTQGKPVTLSSFRGKFVFIDFWASWCVPCRANNPNVVRAYNRFKDDNVVIMGVAFNKTEYGEWLKAIKTDRLPFLNVIDTAYPDKSSVGMQYNIGSIPQNVLIDPSGKIIAKNIEGNELSRKLAEVLGKTTM